MAAPRPDDTSPRPAARALLATLAPEPRRHRVCALFAHPDDEAWAAGATLAALADAGAAVHIVFATAGEAGTDLRERRDGDLATARLAEADAAALALGVPPPRCLGLPDGGLDQHEALDTLVRDALVALRPTLVLGLGADGGYPHRDHVALAAATTRALADWPSAQGAAPPLWCAAFLRGTFAPLIARLDRRADVLVAGWRALEIGLPRRALEARPTRRVAVAGYEERKLAAIAAHRSQLEGGDPRRLLGAGVVDRLLEVEWWRPRPDVAAPSHLLAAT